MSLCNENLTYISGVIVSYWLVSITMVYLNKYLMTNNTFSIPVPLFISWFQCLVTSIICAIAGYFGERAQKQLLNDTSGMGLYSKLSNVDLDASMSGGVGKNGKSSSNNNNGKNGTHSNGDSTTITNGFLPTTVNQPGFLSQFPKPEYKPSIALRIFPLSVIFVGMIAFNNLCLTYVQVSFYNVARSLTIVSNIFLSWLLLGVKSSSRTVACLLLVIAGYYIGCKGEINYSTIGTNCGIISSLFVSLNSIYTKKVLSLVDDNHWKLTFYNNINACVILLPFIYHYEMEFILIEHAEQLDNPMYWACMLFAASLGFMIGIVTVMQIKATSPLCHNFSGTGKALIQSLLAFYIWKNQPTHEGIVGLIIVLGGSLLYTYVKMKESSNSALLMKSFMDVESKPTVTSSSEGR